jgi:uncharacterized membrane protein YjgN (DUF898 family)
MDEQPSQPSPTEPSPASASESATPLTTPLAGVADPAPPVTETLSFTGDGWEYFKIWIVNVALTIVTLGIYSAWAKVRRLQYFYRNTHLAGASFDYHGDPIAIFKGRLIAGFLFFTYTVAGFVSPFLAIAVLIGIMCLMPWMLARSLRFRLRNSSYRGLTFRFTGSTKSAYWVFFGLPVLTVMTLGLLGPFWHQRMKRYQFNHAHFGRARFGSEPSVGDFYVTHIAALMIGGGFLFVLIAIMASIIGIVNAAAGFGGDEVNEEAIAIGTLIGISVAFPIYLVGILTLQAFVTARVRNTVWNATRLGSRVFASTLRTRSLVWLTLTNLVATIGTFGLFWPFAQVRLAKYYASTLTMTGPETFTEFEAADDTDENAVGEEITDTFDFDIAF